MKSSLEIISEVSLRRGMHLSRNARSQKVISRFSNLNSIRLNLKVQGIRKEFRSWRLMSSI